MTGSPISFDVVVPTLGRESLPGLLGSLASQAGPRPSRVVVVDDRPSPSPPLDIAGGPEVVRSGGRGPAAARNRGWRRCSAEWVVFVDDDVVLPPDWSMRLGVDLENLGSHTAGSQGRLRVPLPTGRRPTDWERNVRGLERAAWATADMAYRRRVLEEVGGFEERFRRAYREDSDLALRVMESGYRLVRGRRLAVHPVRREPPWASLHAQAGNADDVLMRALHGRRWRERSGAHRGRRLRHLGITVAGAGAVVAGAARNVPLGLISALVWTAGTAELAWRRIAPGPRTPRELRAMIVTSALIPPLAIGYWLRGVLRFSLRSKGRSS